MSATDSKTDEKSNDLAIAPSHTAQGTSTAIQHDEVFGTITEGGPNYRNVGWVVTSVLMMKSQIGLGVLSIPTAFHSFGIVPGTILLCTTAVIATWGGYMVGVFKNKHPEIYGIDDVGAMFFGRIGREIFGLVYVLFFAFCAGSAMLSMSIGFNALSNHGACTAIFVAVSAVIGFSIGSIRTLSRVGWIAWAGVSCILTSIIIVTIAVGLQDHPSTVTVPKGTKWKSDYEIVASPSFIDASYALSTIVFSFAGTATFFNMISEMRNPRDFNKSLIACQSTVVGIYLLIAIVVYYFCGSYVASPALGSAGPLIKKVCYGIALPGLLASCVILTHLPAKHIFIRLLRGTKHLSSNSPTHWCTWLGCTFGITMLAYIIASAVPNFGDLVSLIGALLGTFLTFQPYGGMWLYDNWATGRLNPTRSWYARVAWAVFVIVIGTYLQISGTYATVATVIKNQSGADGSKVWSCADNSASS